LIWPSPGSLDNPAGPPVHNNIRHVTGYSLGDRPRPGFNDGHATLFENSPYPFCVYKICIIIYIKPTEKEKRNRGRKQEPRVYRGVYGSLKEKFPVLHQAIGGKA
jgi:hypothetical protein